MLEAAATMVVNLKKGLASASKQTKKEVSKKGREASSGGRNGSGGRSNGR